MNLRRLGLFLPIIIAFLTACEKKEAPIPLPKQGDAIIRQVSMGKDYRTQIFFDFATDSVIKTSNINEWDLAFGSPKDGYPIYINGGKDMYVYNTGKTDITQVTDAPAYGALDVWKMDAPEGWADSTAFGAWCNNGESFDMVYIIKTNPANDKDTFKKIKIVRAQSDYYEVTFGGLRSQNTQTVKVPIDPTYNYAYLSLQTGAVVYPEPPKDSWDVVFTRYKYIYRELNNFPYLVNGVLLNPYKVKAADSLPPFAEVTAGNIVGANYSSNRDVIGFDWKSYSIEKGLYTVDKNHTYMVESTDHKRNKSAYFKLHFLDYYDAQGQQGSPTFEYQQLQ